MKDMIDRQAAIKLVADYLYNLMSPRCIGLTPDHCWKEAEDIMAKATSAEPERKKGRWIHKSYICGVAYCSECDFELHINNCRDYWRRADEQTKGRYADHSRQESANEGSLTDADY